MSSITAAASASSPTYEVGLVYNGSAPSAGQVDAGQGSVVATGAERLNLRAQRFAVRDNSGSTAYEVQSATDNLRLNDTKAAEFTFVFDLSGSVPSLTVGATDISGVDLFRTSSFTVAAGSPFDAASCLSRTETYNSYTANDPISFSASPPNDTYICFRADDQSTNPNQAYLAVQLQKETTPPDNLTVTITPSTATMLYADSRTLTIAAQDADSGLASIGYRRSANASTVCTDGTLVLPPSGFGSGASSATVTDTFSAATVEPFYVCAFAADVSGNRSTATAMVRLVTNIDPDAPTIMPAGPSTAVALTATIEGNVSSVETTSSSVSGLASFGYAQLGSLDSCTTATVTTVSSLNPAGSPNDVLAFSTSANGVSLCFVAVDNAGNIAAARSGETANLDNTAPVHPGAVTISDSNTTITIAYAGANDIVLTTATASNLHHGITVSVADGDSIRNVAITSTPSVSGRDLVIPVRPSAGNFTVDGVSEVLVQGVGTSASVALSRAGRESYVVTIPGGAVSDIVGNVDNDTEVTTDTLTANADAVLVTLGERSSGTPSSVTAAVVGHDATTASFAMNLFFSEVVSTSTITAGDFRVYRIGDGTDLASATTSDSVEMITPTAAQLTLTQDSSLDRETSIDLAFSGVPYVSTDTAGYLVSFINDGDIAGGCYNGDDLLGASYPYPNQVSGDECVGTSAAAVQPFSTARRFNISVFLYGAF